MDLFDRRPPGRDREAQGGAADAQEETIEGTVDRVVFSGGGGEFTVARLTVEGRGDPITIVGGLLGVPVGARLRVTGRRETNPRFGPQFRVTGYTEIAPATIEGIRKYLGSGLIKGIGPEFAARIVDRFGIDTLELLDRDPGRINEVAGIGPTRAKAIRDAWSAQREVRKVMVFLQGYGVSPAFAARIYKRYGAAAIAQVRENPYRLAFDVWGIGFLSADKLAAALGIARESDARVDAGVRHVLQEASTTGDVFVPRERLVRGAAALLGVDEALVQPAVDRLARAGDVAVEARPEAGPGDGGEAVYDTGLHRAEVALGAWTAAIDGRVLPSGFGECRSRARLVSGRGAHHVGVTAGECRAARAARTGLGGHGRTWRRKDDDRARDRVDPGAQGFARSPWPRRRGARQSACRRRPDSRRRRCTACWNGDRPEGCSVGTPLGRWMPICWSWTRRRCWMSDWPPISWRRWPRARGWCWSATWTSFRRWGRGRCCAT